MDVSQKGQGDREDYRSLGNGKHARSQSPLKFFAEAKKSINDVFKDIAEYVTESQNYLNGRPIISFANLGIKIYLMWIQIHSHDSSGNHY